MSDSLQPHWLQHTRFPCPSLSPRVCSNSYLLSQWCHLTSSSSAIPFLFCLQSGCFSVNQLFTSVAIVLELQLQHQSLQWIFRVDLLEDWPVWSSYCSRDSQESYPALQFKSINLWCSAFFMVQLSHPYITSGKTIALIIWIFISKVMFLLFNVHKKQNIFGVTFHQRSKHLLISWLQSQIYSQQRLLARKNKIDSVYLIERQLGSLPSKSLKSGDKISKSKLKINDRRKICNVKEKEWIISERMYIF